jgi:hypothetical protein
MTLEEKLKQLLSPVVDGRLFPDEAPEKTPLPYATYQQVGGQSLWYSGGGVGSHRHARIQFNVWAKTRAEATELIETIEQTLAESGLIVQSYGSFTSLNEPTVSLRGARQDFGLWFPRN